jgi:hypothetical protein
MRLLLSYVLLCVTLTASPQDVKLVHATSQQWYAGMEGGGNGYYYKITLEAKDSTIIPDTLWIGKNFYRIHSIYSSGFTKFYNKGSQAFTYYISTESLYNPVINDSMKVITTTRYEGAALITYQYKKAHYSFIIKEFEVLPAIYYP